MPINFFVFNAIISKIKLQSWKWLKKKLKIYKKIYEKKKKSEQICNWKKKIKNVNVYIIKNYLGLDERVERFLFYYTQERKWKIRKKKKKINGEK